MKQRDYAYQLPVVVDDSFMQLVKSYGRRSAYLDVSPVVALPGAGIETPRSYHVPLILDENGNRLAGRHASLSLLSLRKSGVMPEEIRARYLAKQAGPP